MPSFGRQRSYASSNSFRAKCSSLSRSATHLDRLAATAAFCLTLSSFRRSCMLASVLVGVPSGSLTIK
eukprot:scaffold8478_cov105-Cylindrotheca_fusiformis.AAC.1